MEEIAITRSIGYDFYYSVHNEKAKKFSDFLKTLTPNRLDYYFQMCKLYDTAQLESKPKEFTEGIKKAILVNMFCMYQIEGKNTYSARFDDEGEWLVRILFLIAMEKLRRLGLVENSEGSLLQELKIPEMEVYLEEMKELLIASF